MYEALANCHKKSTLLYSHSEVAATSQWLASFFRHSLLRFAVYFVGFSYLESYIFPFPPRHFPPKPSFLFFSLLPHLPSSLVFPLSSSTPHFHTVPLPLSNTFCFTKPSSLACACFEGVKRDVLPQCGGVGTWTTPNCHRTHVICYQ